MFLILEHPELSRRDCNVCLIYQLDTKGKHVKRHGENMKRPSGTGPACRYGKCERGSPDKDKALTLANRMAYQHYMECKATGNFPDDPIVKRNAAIIRSVEENAEKGFHARTIMMSVAGRK